MQCTILSTSRLISCRTFSIMSKTKDIEATMSSAKWTHSKVSMATGSGGKLQGMSPGLNGALWCIVDDDKKVSEIEDRNVSDVSFCCC